MEFLKPEMIALIVGVIGFTEGIKKMGLKLPTVAISLVLSIGAGIISADPITLKTAGVSAIIVYGVSTLAYEAVVKRVEGIWADKLR